MTRTVCFMDKEGNHGTCGLEGMEDKQLISIIGTNIIDCKKCPTYLMYKGEENEHFIYTNWTGFIEPIPKSTLISHLTHIENIIAHIKKKHLKEGN